MGDGSDHTEARTLAEESEPDMGSRRCIGGLFPGRGGEFPSSASVVRFVETLLVGGAGGFVGPVKLGLGEPPNLGVDINEAAAAATRPGPSRPLSSV